MIRIETIGTATLYLGDCREILPKLTGVDVCITDPPYGTGGRRRAQSGAGSNPAGSIVREAWDDGSVDWLKYGNWPVFTFFPADGAERLLQAATLTGRTKHRTLYMCKRDPMPQFSGRISWSVEPIWVLSKDGFQLYGGTDWRECSTPRAGRDADATGHPYQKPTHILEWLILKTSLNAVLDPFAGSGTCGVACAKLGRRFIGIEVHEPYFDMMCRRIEEAQRHGDLLRDIHTTHKEAMGDLLA